MRRFAAILTTAFLAFSCLRQAPVPTPLQGTAPADPAAERDAFAEIAQDVNRAGNVFYMYDHNVPAVTPAPKGYKPVYISHYGRHGARKHEADADFTLVCRLFYAARDRGLLTERGKEFLKIYETLYPELYQHGGDLTEAGVAQQRVIAHNMRRNFRRVLHKGAKVDAISTTVPRCILTMSAFCEQLKIEDPSLQITRQASNSTMYYANPFTIFNKDVQATDEGFNNRSAWWKDGFNEFFDQTLSPEKVFGSLITDLSILEEFAKPSKLEFALYEVAQSLQDCPQFNVSLWDFFPLDELCKAYEVANVMFFLTKGPDTLFQKGRQWAFVWTTMQNILDQADEDLSNGEYAARLRFGHDIIPMALLVLLDVDGYNRTVGDLSEVKDVFHSYDYPMSLNLQFVFYRNRASDTLVRVLYNERDISFDIPDCGTPHFYRWDDFRSFAQERIAVAREIIATTQAPPQR